MSEVYRKILMDVNRLWEVYHKDFQRVKGGFSRMDKETGLEFIYPEKLYQLASGEVLKPDHWRKDEGLFASLFCLDYHVVSGDFSYICGTYREKDGHKQFIFSFDTELSIAEC